MDNLGERSAPPMTFTIGTPDPDTAVVTISGELDIANIDQLEAAVAPIIATGTGRLVLELGGVGFADSSAIALWVRWATAVRELRLRDVSPLLAQVIETMGLAGKLRLEP